MPAIDLHVEPNLLDVDGMLQEQHWIAHGSWTFCSTCGRRRADGQLVTGWQTQWKASVSKACPGGCDLHPKQLQEEEEEDVVDDQAGNGNTKQKGRGKLKTYVTPQLDDPSVAGDAKVDWPTELLELTEKEACSLSVIKTHQDFTKVTGGKAPVSNEQKTAVVRASRRNASVESGLPTARARRAYDWLLLHNTTYVRFIAEHAIVLSRESGSAHVWIPTATLLLQMLGVEVAARPWLYPRAAFGDSDLKTRLVSLGRIQKSQLPSLKASWMRKFLSRCVSYEEDFPLFCRLHDIALARQISSVVSIATKKEAAPEAMAAGMQNFDIFWKCEMEKLETCADRWTACRTSSLQLHPASGNSSTTLGCKSGARLRTVSLTAKR